MKLTKKHKIVLSVLILGVVIYFSSQYIIAQIITKYLPVIVQEENDSPYNFTYTSVKYSLANRKLSLQGIVVEPKEESYKTTNTYVQSKIQELEIHKVAIWHLLKTKELIANGISLTEPDIKVYKQDHLLDTITPKKHNFIKNIDIKEIRIKKAHLAMYKASDEVKLHEVVNLNILIKGIYFGKETQEKRIPFQYQNYEISCDSTFTNLGHSQYLTTGTIKVNKEQLITNNLVIETKQNTHNNAISPNKLFSIVVPQLEFKGTDWGYKNEKDFYLNFDLITTNKVDLSIKDNPKKHAVSNNPTHHIATILPIKFHVGKIDFREININSQNEWIIEKGEIVVSDLKNTASNKLEISKIELNKPNIAHHPKKALKKTNATDINFADFITIDAFKLTNATFSSFKENTKTPLIQTKNINTTLSDIEFSAHTIKNTIPFSYKNLTTSVDDINITSDPLYNISIQKINANNKSISINNLNLKPKYSTQKTLSMFTYANDIYTVSAKKIEFDNYHWGFDSQHVFYFNTANTTIDHLNANIFRDKTLPLNPAVKPLFSKKLRDLPFGLNLTQVKLTNSIIEYEETDKNAVAPGKLTFADFNATIQNINSGYQQKALPTTTIVVDARFMNAAPMHVDWSFNILNPADEFSIRGTVKNFPATAMQPFLQPYIKASTDGTISLVRFDFTGDNTMALGEFGMNYDNLKVILYHKNGKKERRLLSELGNLLIHNNSEGRLKDVHIKKVHRVEDKSFFNYLWLCILQGLKQTIL